MIFRRSIIAAILAALLTGCASTEAPAVTVYAGDNFSVTRQGRETCITDATTGTEYHILLPGA